MKTITISAVFSLCLLLVGCSFSIESVINNQKIKGEGEIITEQFVLESFESLELKRGWQVILQPASSNYMVVEANKNLLEVFEYENQNGKLKIGASKQISVADAKHITLYFTEDIESIKVSSGTEVSSMERLSFNNLSLNLSSGSEVKFNLKAESLDVETSSGAELTLALASDNLAIESSSGSTVYIDAKVISTRVESSSGAEIILKGQTSQLKIETSSGSTVKAQEFRAKEVFTEASSGSSIFVYPIESLKAGSSSGGTIDYYAKPSGRLELNKSKSGGSINKK